ncbi:recombinase family protein [Pengzhenrongella phosphoraccumulans]|uniref:recombinase family protein n=1 Tax=Pengzhenrongella phosphoraccumulans TaxID=3114394 RepID=UPI00389087C0
MLYGRASRDPRGGGTSVTKQLERGRDFASRENLEVIAEIRDDNRSASRGSGERAGFAEVRALVERGAANLLVLWEVSRSSRDLEEFMRLVNACSDSGLQIAVSGTRYDPSKVDDWLPLAFQGVMAEAEARRIRQRNVDSVETNARRGTPHGRIPYGYRRVYDPQTGVLLNQTPYDEHDPSRLSASAQILADAGEAVLEGVSLRQICRELNARGVPTPRKPRTKTLADNPAGVVNSWEPSTLRQLLLNPTIAGRRVHRREDIGPAAWEPIVDYGTWLRLRSFLKDPTRLTVSNPRGPAPRHLLSGIAKCGECGARLKAAINRNRMPRAYTCRNEGCMTITAAADRVDEHVEAVLLALFGRPDFQRALASAHRRREHAAEDGLDVASRIAEKETEFETVEELREAGELTLRAYAAETKRIEAAIEQLQSEQVASVSPPALRRLLTAATLQAGWESADLVDRREVVRLLLDVTIKRATLRGRLFDVRRVDVTPSDVLLQGAQFVSHTQT